MAIRMAARSRRRGGWSGSGSFEFNIERYLHLPTRKYFEPSSEEVPSDIEESKEWEYKEIPLTVTGFGYFTPGYVTGAPEDCYPDEGELEIESIKDENENDWMNLLTKDEMKDAEERLTEFCKDDSY